VSWSSASRVHAYTGLSATHRGYDRRDQYGLLADTTPHSKLIINEVYNLNRWSFGGVLTRYGSWVSYNTPTAALDQTFGAKWILDLAVNYTLDRWTFTLGGDNVLNTYPDHVIPANDNNGTLPYSAFSPFGFNGAYVYGKVAYRW
jgi:iron complex outermembrane receptor protein